MVSPILPVLSPAEDTVPRICFHSQRRAFHGYAECLRQDAGPNPICVHGSRIFLPSLQKILSQSWLMFPPKQIHQLCRFDKYFPPDRSYCLSINHSPSCCVPYALFFHFFRSVPVCGLRNARSNKAVQSSQKNNRFPYLSLLSVRKIIRCNSPNKYSALHVPHLYVHCSQCRTCGHYA